MPNAKNADEVIKNQKLALSKAKEIAEINYNATKIQKKKLATDELSKSLKKAQKNLNSEL